MSNCDALCCKRGNLLLINQNELNVIVDNNLKNKNCLKKDPNGFLLYDLENFGCKNLVNNLCIEHKNPNRPIACKQYPIFEIKNKLMFAKTCPAINSGLINEEINDLKKQGVEFY